jgi:hypothetical protein
MREIIVAPWVLAFVAAAGCSRQESAWQHAERERSAAAYEEYLERFPAGAHAGQARAGLLELQEAAAWARAERLHTPESWQRYLAEWPGGAHAAEAREALVAFIPPAPRPAPAGAGFEIQLGAWSDEAAARAALAGWAGRQADLGGLVPRLVAPERDGPAVWRLRAGPFDEAAARVVCEDLRSSGADCVPVAAGSAGAPP